MLEFFLSLPGQFGYMAQLYIAECLVVAAMPKRKYWGWRFFAATVVFFVCGWFTPDKIVWHFLYLPFLSLFAVTLLSLAFVLDVKSNLLIFSVANMFLMQHTAECFTMCIRYLIGTSLNSWWWMIESLLCYILTYAFFFRFFVTRVQAVEIKSQKIMLLSFFVFFGVFSLRNLAVDAGIYQMNNLIITIYNCYAALSCVFCATLLFSINKEDKLVLEKNMMNKLLVREQERYTELVASQDLINRKCHDLKYQVVALRRNIVSDDKEKYLAKLEKDVMIYENMAKTGNVSLDNTLSDKLLLCEQRNIKFSYTVDSEALSFIEPTDVYSLFGNAVDNAIECVSRYKDDEKRIISLYVFKSGNILKIHMENYCEEDLKIKDGLLTTTKANKDFHGYGLKSIQFIAEKYGGYMAIGIEHKLFSLDIMIPNPA